ncbi:MAG: shikimate kinase [Runella sp.]
MKNIFLIGLPSSGKTTLGKQLARHIRYRFVDTDALIVKNEGMSIADIFAHKGEDAFRQMEANILRAIRPDSKLIVATGGGLPCFHQNMDYIKIHGISIFLDIPPGIVAERIRQHSTDDRPLYQQHDRQLLDTIMKKYMERLPFYQQADFIIKNDNIEVKQLLDVLHKTIAF